MRSRRFVSLLSIFLMMMASMACSTLEGLRPDFLNTPTPPPLPTPISDMLVLDMPQYIIQEIAPNQVITGTQIQFIGQTGTTYDLKIDGAPAPKQEMDSLLWQGVIAPGVFAKYDLQIYPPYEHPNTLKAVGDVELSVFAPLPIESAQPSRTDPPLQFNKVTIDWLVPIAGTVPGTTFIYQGENQGTLNFAGSPQYGARQLGDSLLWRGSLRDNVFISYNLRVSAVEQQSVRLIGTAELTIYP